MKMELRIGNGRIAPAVAVILIVLGAAAVLAKKTDILSVKEFFMALGVFVMLAGILTVAGGFARDGPRDMIFGGCMIVLVGFVLYMTDIPESLIFWLAVIVLAELGLKLFFSMPLGIADVDLGSDAAEKAAGFAAVAAAVVLIVFEPEIRDCFMYLFGGVAIVIGAVILAQLKGEAGETSPAER